MEHVNAKLKTSVFVAALAAFFLTYYTYPLHTEDAIWSELIGEWVWMHRAVPTHDLWTWTSYGQNWYAQEWGFDTLLYLLNRVGGYVLSAIYMTVVSVATWAIIGMTAKKEHRSASYFVTIVAALCSFAWTDYRAEVFSYLFVAVTFWTIKKALGGKYKPLIILPVLEVIWANTHGSFPLGIVLVEFTAMIASLPTKNTWWLSHTQEKKGAKYLAIAGITMGITALLNPRTWHLYVFALWLSTKADMPKYINEWQPTTFTHIGTILVALLVLGGILNRLLGKSKPTLYELAIMAVLIIAFLKAIRFGSYVLLATPIFLYGQNRIYLAQGRLKMVTDFFSPLKQYKSQIYGGLLVSLIVLSVSPLRHVHGALMNNVNPRFKPHALQVVETLHKEHPSWKLWNEYDLGGTLEMAGIPVAIDGRTDLYAPDGVLKDYVQIRNSDVGAYSKFLHYDANYVCIYKTDSLGELLDVSHAWAKVYSGKLYEVYVRKGVA